LEGELSRLSPNLSSTKYPSDFVSNLIQRITVRVRRLTNLISLSHNMN